MVKPVTQKHQHENEASSSSSSCKFKGVRKRKWGKYVSEIRLPNSRERIWLGSYDTAEKAARAFDAALFCLRGRTAKFNFPDNPPEIVNGRSLTPAEIQVAAAQFANSVETRMSHSGPGRVENLEPDNSSSLSSSELQVDSPSPSVSDGAVHLDTEITNTPLDTGLLDSFSTMGSGNFPNNNNNNNNNNNDNNNNNNFADYGIFPGFDDFSSDYFVPPFPTMDYGDENYYDYSSEGSFLWNF